MTNIKLNFIQGEHWNGPVYNRLDFQYSLKKDKNWMVTTSDNRSIKYEFEKLEQRVLLKKSLWC